MQLLYLPKYIKIKSTNFLSKILRFLLPKHNKVLSLDNCFVEAEAFAPYDCAEVIRFVESLEDYSQYYNVEFRKSGK